MASIDEILQKIAEAIYGKDVRSSIHDGIQICYNEGQTAKNSAASSAESAASAKTEAESFIAEVQSKIDKGELNGKGLTILGYYATLEALQAAVTNPSGGDCYGIGTAKPYDLYVYDAVNSVWVNNGSLSADGATPKGGSTGQFLAKVSGADYDSAWVDPPSTPVQSVNGQTGNVNIAIPTFASIQSVETAWNQSFTTTSDGYATLATLTASSSGLYMVTFTYSGMASFANRAFITVGSSRMGMPLNDSFPTVNVACLKHYNAGDAITAQVYTLEGGTYSYQYGHLDAILIQTD